MRLSTYSRDSGPATTVTEKVSRPQFYREEVLMPNKILARNTVLIFSPVH